jgi:hypothetical protein
VCRVWPLDSARGAIPKFDAHAQGIAEGGRKLGAAVSELDCAVLENVDEDAPKLLRVEWLRSPIQVGVAGERLVPSLPGLYLLAERKAHGLAKLKVPGNTTRGYKRTRELMDIKLNALDVLQ